MIENLSGYTYMLKLLEINANVIEKLKAFVQKSCFKISASVRSTFGKV